MKKLAFASAAACALIAGQALASAAAPDAAAAAAPAASLTLSSFWQAISPAINTTALVAYGLTWAAAALPKAGSNPVWSIARAGLDLIAANVGNAANAPKQL